MSFAHHSAIGRVLRRARHLARIGLDDRAERLKRHARKARLFFERNRLDYSPTLGCQWPPERNGR